MTFAHKGKVNRYKPLDTIIKLDNTNRFPKLTKGKKSTATPGIKSAVNTADTTDKQNLDDNVKAVAEDSTVISEDHDFTYLYGKARVTYGDFELDANYIRWDKKNKTLFAKGNIDPRTKRYVNRPISKQKDESPITSDSLIFNYATKYAYAWNISTEQNGNYISKGQVKKISETEVAYQNVIFSTCDKPSIGEDPDFGLVITRGIGEKKHIISGPAYLEIEGVPLPIAIPFGYFPKPDTRTSGVILPTFGEDAKLGFYVRGLGYYIGLGDYADLTNLGTYYSNGSYEVSSSMDYMKRYKHNGNLTLSYGSHNYGLQGDPAKKDFNITWIHTQNSNAHPGTNFSASVNAGTSSFYQNNPATVGYNSQTLTQNTLRSSISYGKTWAGTPFNLTVALSHSQDLTRKTVTLDLPNFNFGMSTINPFDSKDNLGDKKWYEKITVGYTLAGTNHIREVPESELFQSTTLTKKMQNGFQHHIPVSLSLNVLKYFQFNTGVDYNERWYLQSIRKHFARADSLVTDTIPGFKRVGDYTLSAGFSTKLYGTLNFKGKIKAIRHVMTPNIGFSYRPDYSSLDRSYNRSIVSNATVPFPVVSQRYSIFDNSVFGGPSGGRQAGIALSVDNTLEAKLRPKSTDTSQDGRKIQLLQSLQFSTFYNFAADSFRLSPISVSGHTKLFNVIDISFGASFNPYVTKILDSIASGQIIRYARPVNRFTFQDGKLPGLTNFTFSAGGNLNPDAFHPHPNNAPTGAIANATPEQAQKLALLNSDPNAYVDFSVPWDIHFGYSFSYYNNYLSTNTTNTIMMDGNLSLTQKWKVRYDANYDLKAMKLSTLSFQIYRDLHCWDLSMQWTPFGYFKSYSVTLRVKSLILQALKISKRNDYTGNGYFAQ